MTRLEIVEFLGLLNAVAQHVQHGDLPVHRPRQPQARVVERQEVEQVRARERLIVLRVVRLVPEHRRELAEVDLEAVGANRKEVSPVDLPHVAVDVGPGLVRGTALNGVRRLPELQVDAETVASPGLDVGRRVDHQRRLLDAESIAAGVVRTQHQHAVRRRVPVALIVTLERRPEGDVAPRVR